MSFINRKNLVFAGIIWGISLAVLVPAYWFIIKNQYSELDKINNSIQNLTADVNEAKYVSAEDLVDKYRSQLNKIKAEYNGFIIPSKDDIQTLASIEIENISNEIGLQEFHIDPWNANEIAAFSECKYVFGQPMEVTFKATFTEFAKFLNKLERYKSVIFINSFSISRSLEKDGKNQVRMELAVLVEKQISSTKSSG